MKYESTILKRLIDTYGVVGNPRYRSEIIKEFIVRGKERFPNLFTYQADWLAHIDGFGLNPTYTVSYTGQSIYAPNTLERPVKSATLKGSTKYRDIDTGEFLETFEEGRNLELVSVKMPGLTTTGKNLWKHGDLSDFDTMFINDVIPEGSYYFSGEPTTTYDNPVVIALRDNENNVISHANIGEKITINKKAYQIAIYSNGHSFANSSGKFLSINNFMMEKNELSSIYEPYKTNILTVNDDVTLRSNESVYDELDLLTGKLTQRIDENGEVLSQESVKTVDLSILDQNGQNVKQPMSFNGGTHFNTNSSEGSLLPTLSVSVETDLEETLMMCSLEGNTL